MTNTYADVDINNLSLEGAAFELVPEGSYTLVLSEIEPFHGTDFKTGAPKVSLKFIWAIESGDWEGLTVDCISAIPANITDDRATLHKIWKGHTGETPVEGGTYKPITLKGKRCTGFVTHKKGEKGTFANVTAWVPIAPAPRRARPAAVPVAVVADDGEEDDDLAGA